MNESEELSSEVRDSPEPQLEVRWSGGWEDLRETVRALRVSLDLLPTRATLIYFRNAFLARDYPAPPFLLSVLLHVLFIVAPLPEFLTRPPVTDSPLDDVRIEFDLQWAATSRVLPPISPTPEESNQPSPGGEENQPLPPQGADIPHQQTIVSDPPNPNHPTQTLLQQFALDNARIEKRELKLPNMVIPPAQEPAAEVDLRRLKIPNAPVDLSGPPQAPMPPRPKTGAEIAMEETQLENMIARLTMQPATPGEGDTAAPEVGASLGAPRSGDLEAPGLLALSANPTLQSPVLDLPNANMRARFVAGPYAGSGSPGGVPGGVPGSKGGSGGGPGGIAGGAGGLTAPGILVTPAGPAPGGPVVVGLTGGEGGPQAPAPSPAGEAATNAAESAEAIPKKSPEERAEDLLEGIRPGTRAGRLPSGRRVYTLYINMPNLTSEASSWVLRFAEMGEGSSTAPGGAAEGYPLEAPVPVKKVDPRYPAVARRNGLEGTVFLYGVIREDGGVESIHVVRGVHDLLDESAVAAFARWQFEPGRKNGVTIPLEVVVEVPFRLTKLF